MYRDIPLIRLRRTRVNDVVIGRPASSAFGLTFPAVKFSAKRSGVVERGDAARRKAQCYPSFPPGFLYFLGAFDKDWTAIQTGSLDGTPAFLGSNYAGSCGGYAGVSLCQRVFNPSTSLRSLAALVRYSARCAGYSCAQGTTGSRACCCHR